MDYKGGTYISQGVGMNPTEGAVSAIRAYNLSEISGLVSADKSSIISQIENDGLALLQGMNKVYCATADIRGSMVVFNVVETNET